LPCELGEVLSKRSSAWLSYWKQNPIQRWTNTGELSWFRLEADRFVSRLPWVGDRTVTLHDMTRELVDYQLAKYRVRCREPLDGGLRFDAKVTWSQRDPNLNLSKADSRPRGRVHAVLPNGQVWSFSLQAHFCNVAHPVGENRTACPSCCGRGPAPMSASPAPSTASSLYGERMGGA